MFTVKKNLLMRLVCSSCHKHSTLIANVYPSAPGEEGPKSSALSLLVFYATSKPQKLPKIGSYLEARVEKDLQRLRYGYFNLFFNEFQDMSKFPWPLLVPFSRTSVLEFNGI